MSKRKDSAVIARVVTNTYKPSALCIQCFMACHPPKRSRVRDLMQDNQEEQSAISNLYETSDQIDQAELNEPSGH